MSFEDINELNISRKPVTTAYTRDEARMLFLTAVLDRAHYWSSQQQVPAFAKLAGLVHSFLTIFEGNLTNRFPAELILMIESPKHGHKHQKRRQS